jgi:hypothetical protein
LELATFVFFFGMHSGMRTVQHVSFVLLAEFDINQGSVLAHQYPYPTGIDEQ